MNRQTKRMMQRQQAQRQTGARPVVKPAGAPTKKQRTKPSEFLKEVVAEMKRVAWPTRQEVFAYSLVVLVSCIVIAAIIFGMDFVFARAILALFDIET